MKLENGSLKRTPIWIWLLMLVAGAVVLPGAAMVLAQEGIQASPTLPKGQKLKTDDLTKADTYVWMHRVFEVGDLLERLRKRNLTEITPEARLLRELPVRMPGIDGDSSTPLGRSIQLEEGLTLGNKEPSMKIVGDKLYAFDTKQKLDGLEKQIDTLKEFGFQRIIVQARFVSLPTKELKELGVDWSFADSTVNEMVNVGRLIQYPTFEDSSREYLTGEASLLTNQRVSATSMENGLEQGGDLGRVTAASYTEQNQPALFAILSDTETEAITSKFGGSSEVNAQNVLVMNNGQSGTVSDCVARPFVTGVKKITGKDDPDSFVWQPIIRVVPDGTFLNLKAQSKPDQSIELDCELNFSQVLSVETTELPVKSQSKKQEAITLQVPEVSKQVMQAKLDIPTGRSLALATFRKHGKGEMGKGEKERFAIIALLVPKVVFDENPRQAPVALCSNELLETGRLKKVNEQTFSFEDDLGKRKTVTLPVYGADGDESENVKSGLPVEVTARGQFYKEGPPKGARKKASVRTVEAVDRQVEPGISIFRIDSSGKEPCELIELEGQSVAVQADLKYKYDDGKFRLDDTNIRFDAGDTKLEGENATITFSGKQNIDMLFSGKAKCDYEGSKISGDKIRFFTDGEEKEFRMEVIERGKWNVNGNRLSADKISLSLDTGDVILTGSAQFTREIKNDEPIRMIGDTISWNTVTNELNTTLKKEPAAERGTQPKASYLKDDVQYFPKDGKGKLLKQPAGLEKTAFGKQ